MFEDEFSDVKAKGDRHLARAQRFLRVATAKLESAQEFWVSWFLLGSGLVAFVPFDHSPDSARGHQA